MSLFWGSAEFYADIHTDNPNRYRTNNNDSDDKDDELELLVHAYLRDANYTSRRTTIFNVMYSTFNVGLVALPLAAEQAGLPLFVVGICVIALSAGYTTCMIVHLADEHSPQPGIGSNAVGSQSALGNNTHHRHSENNRSIAHTPDLTAITPTMATSRVRTLEDLCEKAFGQRGFVFVCIVQIIFSMSLMCVTLDVWADIIQSIFTTYAHSLHMGHLLKHRYFGLLCGFALLLPVCLRAKSLSSLRWSSYFSVTAIIFSLLCLLAGLLCNAQSGDEYLSQRETAIKLMEPKSLAWLLSLVATFCFSNNQVRLRRCGHNGLVLDSLLISHMCVCVTESIHGLLLPTSTQSRALVLRRETVPPAHRTHLHPLRCVWIFHGSQERSVSEEYRLLLGVRERRRIVYGKTLFQHLEVRQLL
jgi:hypothetical protein